MEEVRSEVLGESQYEVVELRVRIETNRDGRVYLYSAFMERLRDKDKNAPGSQKLYRFWQSDVDNDWRYRLGDIYITRLIGPIGREKVLDEESHEVVRMYHGEDA
ncbi:MAG: hypothetical protein ACJ8BW_00920 [Ktedonobacteraceae bacterium]